MITSVVLAALAAAPALAHFEVTFPPALRSALNHQYNASQVAADTILPLSNDGSNFPCHGYASDVPSVSTATADMVAGSNFTLALKGLAVLGGGSCQVALSYDGAQTWGVVHEIVGNCPDKTETSYQIPVPAALPAGENVLLAWTWFNVIGNREMHMSCAAVNVVSNATEPYEVPRMFEANISDDCTTTEGEVVDFADPKLEHCSAEKLITRDQKVVLGQPMMTILPFPDEPAETEAPGSTRPFPPASTASEEHHHHHTPAPTETPGSTRPFPHASTATGPETAEWAADRVFSGGAAACFEGTAYTAKWWTKGETPGDADVWSAAGAC